MNTITVAVPNTFYAVTFDPDAYCGKTVYVHQAAQPWFKGERIGTLGGMVGHGAYAQFGEPAMSGETVPNRTGAWVLPISRTVAAIRMATEHLNGVTGQRITRAA